jgi:hypothetical protein
VLPCRSGCCDLKFEPGCAEAPAIQACVCAQVPFCCGDGWGPACVAAAKGCGLECDAVGAPCDDEDVCTTDSCDVAGGECSFAPNACPDDNDPCTLDVCEPESGSCGLPADDGTVCGPTDQCFDGVCTDVSCQGDQDCDQESACIAGTCNLGTGVCEFVTTQCPDDGDPCTEDVCLVQTGVCEAVPIVLGETPCDDGSACTSDDLCGPAGCAGVAVCDDEDICTVDTCSEIDGSCSFEAVSCADDGDPCTDDVCSSETNGCGAPNTGADCDDGNECTASDACNAGVCTGDQFGLEQQPCSNGGTCLSGVCDNTQNCVEAVECDDNDDCTQESCVAGECVFIPEPTSLQIVWVFSDEVSSAGARQLLIDNSVGSGVDVLYVSVYQPTPNAAGRLMYADADLSALITLAHSAGLEVFAAYGAPDWVTLGCGAAAFPQQRMQEVIDYNTDNPTAALDGVALNVEPDDNTSADQLAFVTLTACLQQTLAGSGVDLSATIRHFWDAAVMFPAVGGSMKPTYEHVIDLDLRQVVVMGYDDDATEIIARDLDEVNYATASGKAGAVIAGVETGDCSPACGSSSVTFFEEGQDAMNTALETVLGTFESLSGFGGFALHRYGDAYLGGSAAWPATNVDLPNECFSEVP